MEDTCLGGTGQTIQGKEALGLLKVHRVDISIVGAGVEEKRGDPDGTSSMQVHNLDWVASPVSPSHAPSLTTWVAAPDSFSDSSGDGIFVSHSQAAHHSRAQQHPSPHMEDMKPIFYSPRKPRQQQQQQQQQQDIRPQPHQQQLHVSKPPGQLHSPPWLMTKTQNIPPHHGDNQHGYPSPRLIQRPQHHHDVANFTSSIQ